MPHAKEAEENPPQTGASKGRGRESGIGGKMVRTKAKKAKGVRRKTAAGDEKRESATQMGELSGKGLSDEGRKLAILLTEHAIYGDRNSLERLVDLADATQQGPEAKATASGLSQAKVWEAEPEWLGESSEENAETATASREPENHPG